jgi:hypothetical protein
MSSKQLHNAEYRVRELEELLNEMTVLRNHWFSEAGIQQARADAAEYELIHCQDSLNNRGRNAAR